MGEPSEPYAQHNAECDREPIHVPGAIQPHGMLFVVEPGTLRISQASANLAAHLGSGDVLGRSLSQVIGEPSSARLAEAVKAGSFEAANPVPIVVRGQCFDAILHGNAGATIVELESVADAAERPLSRYALRRALMALESVTLLGDLEQRIVEQVKYLTRFERVMLYRFDEEGYGHVSTELKDADLDSYLGVHYPASDIPRQARNLYIRNWLRIIPDAAYDPVPILPSLRPDTNAPLDLSCAVLRSVSPVHREYLKNMGVAASMSVSLVVRGKLWGLVSCTNHGGPRHVRYEIRSVCEVLARLASLQIEALEEREAIDSRQARRGTEEALVAAMRTDDEHDVLERLMESPMDLMRLTRAGGVAAAVEDRCVTHGEAPEPAFVRTLCEWLDRQEESTLFSTSSLPNLLPAATHHKNLASGLMTLALPGSSTRRLFWFRPERIQTVSWGGDPRKAVESGAPGERPHPRRSFEIWKEEVRERSLPWSTSDIEAAASLRRYAIEIDLERQVGRARRGVRLREEMMAVLSHDLRGFLSVVDMQATLLLQTSGSGQAGDPRALHDAAERIKRAVDRMIALINNVLDLARMRAGQFSLDLRSEDAAGLVEDALLTLSPLSEAKRIVILRDIEGSPRIRVDKERFFQVLANLIGNAVKFTPEGGTITVRATGKRDEVLFRVADSGPGIAPEHLPNVFDRYWRAGSEGEGLGLSVVKGIVEAHGGRVSVASPAGEGATFEFTVPMASIGTKAKE